MEFFGVDLVFLIKTAGYAGLFAIVFAETGLFLGFFLPGDSLLFIAGFLAGQSFFSPPILILGLLVAAILGNMLGYEFGRRIGSKLFSREDSLLFKKNHAIKAHSFYERHGAKTIMLARFIPIVRTFAPIVAGVANMNYRMFLFYNILGAFFWVIGLVALGYFLGSVINVDRYLLPIIFVIILLSLVPGLSFLRKKNPEVESITTSNG